MVLWRVPRIHSAGGAGVRRRKQGSGSGRAARELPLPPARGALARPNARADPRTCPAARTHPARASPQLALHVFTRDAIRVIITITAGVVVAGDHGVGGHRGASGLEKGDGDAGSGGGVLGGLVDYGLQGPSGVRPVPGGVLRRRGGGGGWLRGGRTGRHQAIHAQLTVFPVPVEFRAPYPELLSRDFQHRCAPATRRNSKELDPKTFPGPATSGFCDPWSSPRLTRITEAEDGQGHD
ncbi:hypothetical protein STAS_02009 [Striga asiatica]|uniref:Uncharacterized protein n=1 Tax=Striga asiatica TaxID=4170 RepID=A0A5A7P164_STRAF|nr:hypothetical protein STAS_02009 [Striga asiatica]